MEAPALAYYDLSFEETASLSDTLNGTHLLAGCADPLSVVLKCQIRPLVRCAKS